MLSGLNHGTTNFVAFGIGLVCSSPTEITDIDARCHIVLPPFPSMACTLAAGGQWKGWVKSMGSITRPSLTPFRPLASLASHEQTIGKL